MAEPQLTPFKHGVTLSRMEVTTLGSSGQPFGLTPCAFFGYSAPYSSHRKDEMMVFRGAGRSLGSWMLRGGGSGTESVGGQVPALKDTDVSKRWS